MNATLEMPRFRETSTEHARLAEAREIIAAAVAILDQGADLLRTLSAEAYTCRVPAVFNASIGGHYRHCLDHFSSLLRDLEAAEINYDHRQRDPRLENEPEFALALTRQMRALLLEISEPLLARPVVARCEVSYSHGHSPATNSSFGRELVYAIAHAIHHFALISVMAKLTNVELPAHFGVAPSTVAYLKKVA